MDEAKKFASADFCSEGARTKIPWALAHEASIYSEKYQIRKEAIQRELRLKKWSKAKKEALINDIKATLPSLSREKEALVRGDNV